MPPRREGLGTTAPRRVHGAAHGSGLPAHLEPPACLDPPAALRHLRAAPIVLSLTQVRLLLRTALPLPALDIAVTLDLVSYQQQRKAVAYCSHRKRLLRQLALLHPS